MPRPRKAKQRREPESIAHTLDEIESRGDRITEWVLSNPQPILAAVAAVLLAAAAYGGVLSLGESSREEASADLGAVQADYRRDMGATPDDVVVSEPANPEVARQVREEYVERFQEVAEAHRGTAASAYASLEAGVLQEQLGRRDDAIATWEAASEEVGPSNAMAALLDLKIAAAHEAEGRWLEAAEAFDRAADVQAFPLRYTARADAARCFAEAGEADRALAAYDEVTREAPDAFLPEHVVARLRELRIARRLD